MNKKRQLSINLLANLIAFVINLGISFFLTPYITNTIGVEAYGFVSLGTNLINYASLITISLNSMASRFITIEIHKEDWKNANKYFNSVLIANLFLSVLVVIPSLILILNLNNLLNIPTNLIVDVKLLFLFLLLNFVGSVLFSSFGVATFATNKLYLNALRGIESQIIRVVLLLLVFLLFKPSVYYIGLAALVVTLYVSGFNLIYTKKYLPQIEIEKGYFEFGAVKELVFSGIWNTVIRVGQILLSDMDLLISNLFLSATMMGALALAKTIPNMVIVLIGVISSVFIPDFTKLYAQDKIVELIDYIKKSMKILGIFVNVPIAVLVVFGGYFFSLWVPNQDANLLQTLSLIIVVTFIISGPINSLYSVFTVTNQIKLNAIIILISGGINVIAMFLLLKYTNLGVYGIVVSNMILGIVRNLIFTVPFGAKCLNLKWYTFYPEVLRSFISFLLIVGIGLFLRLFVVINSWLTFFFYGGILGIFGLVLNVSLLFDFEEIKYYFRILLKKVKILS